MWADWGDDCVLYHVPSGKTHLLNAGAMLLLRQVLVVPLTAAEAADRLAELQRASPDSRFQGHIAQLLQRFDALGLVRAKPHGD